MKELLTFIDSAVVKAYKFITKVTIEAGFIVSLLFRKWRRRGSLFLGAGKALHWERGRLFEETRSIGPAERNKVLSKK